MFERTSAERMDDPGIVEHVRNVSADRGSPARTAA